MKYVDFNINLMADIKLLFGIRVFFSIWFHLLLMISIARLRNICHWKINILRRSRVHMRWMSVRQSFDLPRLVCTPHVLGIVFAIAAHCSSRQHHIDDAGAKHIGAADDSELYIYAAAHETEFVYRSPTDFQIVHDSDEKISSRTYG